MSDIIPAGLTRKTPDSSQKIVELLDTLVSQTKDKNEISAIEKSNQRIKEATEMYSNFKSTMELQIQALRESGASDRVIQDRLRELEPLLESQTTKYYQVVEEVQKNVDRFVKETTFSNVEDHQLAKQTLENINSLGNFQEESQRQNSKLMEKFSSSVNTAFDKSFNSFLGPLQLVTSPIEELTGLSFGDTLKEGLSGLLGKKEKIAPRRNELLKHGIEGASAVYLADRLAGKESDQEEGGSELVNSLLTAAGIQGGIKGLAPLLSRIGSLALTAAPAMAGLAAFTALKWDDITDSFSAFQDGRIGEGIETFLLGSRERVTEENATRGMGRQAAAYGAAGLGIATTIGMAGGATVGSALMAAFPPALIAAGVAATAKGIQTAWVLEWDKRAEESADNVRAIFADEDSNWWDKTKASVGYLGKTVFGSIAGGIRNVADESNLGDIWADEEATFIQKIGRSTLDIVQAPRRFLEGTLETAGEYVWNILPDGVQEGLSGAAEALQDRFTGLRERLFGENSRTAKELFSDFRGSVMGFMGGVREGVGDFFQDVRERGIRRAVGDAVSRGVQGVSEFFNNARESISQFFTDVRERGLAGTLEDRINTAIGDADGFFANAGRSIANFFGDVSENGFGAALGERVETLRQGISDFFANAGERIGAFFSDAWDAVRGVDEGGLTRADRSLRRDNIVSQLGGGGFMGMGDSDRFNAEVERYAAANDMNFDKARRELQKDDNALLEIAERLGLDSSVPEASNSLDALNMMAPTTVNDAIVKPDGQIIRTHPDDTIVATKNNPQIVESGIDREVNRNSNSLSGASIDYSNKFDTMIQYLSQLVDVSGRGGVQMNNSSSPQFNFNKLRLGDV